MEWISGRSIREVLDAMIAEGRKEEVNDLMKKMGQVVAKLHQNDIVHGDLTTSNVMVRGERKSGLLAGATMEKVDAEVVLIDLGLGMMSTQEEDKAVDLYVLERAFLSTHPQAEDLFQDVLTAYEGSFKGAKAVMKRLADVRMRGRKRSMLG